VGVDLVVLPDGVVCRVEDLDIGLENLLRHRVAHQVLDVFEVHADERAGRADAGRVPHDLTALLAGEAAQVERVDVPVVLLGALLEVGDLGGVEQPLVVDDDPALAEVVEVLRERLDLLVAVVGLLLGIPSEAVAEREQEVVPVAAGLDLLVARSDLYVRVAAADPRRVVAVREDVQPRPHQGLREVLARRVDPVTGTTRDSPDEFIIGHSGSPRPLGPVFVTWSVIQ
jgi:hypothetical protein